jgi:hypothetical protein
MVITEIKKEKYNLIFLALFGIIAMLVFQQSETSTEINKSQNLGIQYLRSTFNQSQNNYDGIVLSVNTTLQNHRDHQKELANQAILLNQTNIENGLLKSINASLGQMLVASNITTDNNNSTLQKPQHINATLKHYN